MIDQLACRQTYNIYVKYMYMNWTVNLNTYVY